MRNFQTRIFLFFGTIAVFLVGCTSQQARREEMAQESHLQPRSYPEVLERNSRSLQLYDGLQNAVDIKVSFLSPQLVQLQIEEFQKLYEWQMEKATEEYLKRFPSNEGESRFFVSFFSPEKKHDDLAKNKTLWRIFVEVNGKRYEGKATRLKLLDSELQSLFIYHTAYATPYMIAFPIPAKDLVLYPFSLKIAGPVAKVDLVFDKRE